LLPPRLRCCRATAHTATTPIIADYFRSSAALSCLLMMPMLDAAYRHDIFAFSPRAIYDFIRERRYA